MAQYTFHGLTLEVNQEEQEARVDLAQLLQDLSFISGFGQP